MSPWYCSFATRYLSGWMLYCC